MIYIAGLSTGNMPTPALFLQKGITGLTQAQPSKLLLLAKPEAQQVAYAGYKSNIESFLYATFSKKRITIPAAHSLAVDTFPGLPLTSPALMITFKKTPDASVSSKMLEAWRSYNPRFETTGKKNDTSIFVEGLPLSEYLRTAGLFRLGPIIDNRASHPGAYWYFKILSLVNLFLATHTYAFKKTEEVEKKKRVIDDVATLGLGLEHRISTGWYRQGYSDKAPKGDVAAKRRKIDQWEEEDLNPDMDTASHAASTPFGSGVFLAKPSAYPATVNIGPASAVPSMSGILFPYFPGMLPADAHFIREIVGRRFFLNLGPDPRNAYRNFRAEFGTIAGTQKGKELTHMLVGVELALESQSRLFVLYERDTYLGFVLLGDAFSVFINGHWKSPMSAETLSSELATIRTFDNDLRHLGQLLGQMGFVDGSTPMMTVKELSDTSYLASLLVKVKLDNEDFRRKAEGILGRIVFPRKYRVLSVGNIEAAIGELVSRTRFTGEFYITPTNWARMAEPEYSVLASFGPTSFSFLTAGGEELSIKSELWSVDEKVEGRKEKIIMPNKKILVALDDWKKFRASQKVLMKFSERAALSRATTFSGSNMMKLITALRSLSDVSMDDEDDEVVPEPDVIVGMSTVEDASSLF